jgi:hypothetical protein
LCPSIALGNGCGGEDRSIHHRVACRPAPRAKPSASLKRGTLGDVGRDDLRLWPTAAATATRADRGGRRRAATPRAPKSKMSTNGAELRRQSLKTGATDREGLRPLLCALHASWCPTRTRRSHVRPLGRVGKARLGSGAPRSPYSTAARPRTAGRAVWYWLLGLQRPHVGGLGALWARRHVELDDLPLIK